VSRYKKVAIVRRERPSAWVSCQAITNNLEKMYQKVFSDVFLETMYCPENLNDYSGWDLANQIKKGNFDLVVWIDHKPNIAPLIRGLKLANSDGEQIPACFIHLFGDFVLDCMKWETSKNFLKDVPVHFFVASNEQKKLVQFLFNEINDSVTVLPFPVDESSYSFNEIERKQVREDFALGEKKILFYSGRISLQKNIIDLIQTYVAVREMCDFELELWIAGDWDDILLPYIGRIGAPGTYYANFTNGLEGMNLDGVKFVGNLEIKMLRKHYLAADYFVSFSTYNDEDYGMAPAEAGMCGLPLILSRWGGYISFGDIFHDVTHVPLKLTQERVQIDKTIAIKQMFKEILKEDKDTRRIARSIYAKEAVSIQSVANFIKKEIDRFVCIKMVSFSPDFYSLCSLFRMNPLSPFKGRNGQFVNFYYNLYSYYGLEKNRSNN